MSKMKGDVADLKAATDKLFDAAEEDRSASEKTLETSWGIVILELGHSNSETS